MASGFTGQPRIGGEMPGRERILPPEGLTPRELGTLEITLEKYGALSPDDVRGDRAEELGKRIGEEIQNLGLHLKDWGDLRRWIGEKYLGTGLGVIAERIRFGITKEEEERLRRQKFTQ